MIQKLLDDVIHLRQLYIDESQLPVGELKEALYAIDQVIDIFEHHRCNYNHRESACPDKSSYENGKGLCLNKFENEWCNKG